jgi:hypothetical protein
LAHALCHHTQLDFFGLGGRLVGELGAIIVPAPASRWHLRSIPTRKKRKKTSTMCSKIAEKKNTGLHTYLSVDTVGVQMKNNISVAVK